MPACMLMVPNPRSRNEWPAHCDGEIHYVWPFKFGTELVPIIVFAITDHIPRKQNKAAKQHHELLFDNFAKLTARIPRKQNKAAKQHYYFPFHNPPNFISWRDQVLAVFTSRALALVALSQAKGRYVSPRTPKPTTSLCLKLAWTKMAWPDQNRSA